MPGRPQEVKFANCSADKARKFLNYKTTKNLDEGLEELILWIKKMGPKKFHYHLPLEFETSLTPVTWSKKSM
jgi:UDP-glucose 4-epimerase